VLVVVAFGAQVFMNIPLSVAQDRDPKGLYAKVRVFLRSTRSARRTAHRVVSSVLGRATAASERDRCARRAWERALAHRGC